MCGGGGEDGRWAYGAHLAAALTLRHPLAAAPTPLYTTPAQEPRSSAPPRCSPAHPPPPPTPPLCARMQISQPLVPLVDEFAARLFGELDYEAEGRNAERFERLYAHVPVREGVWGGCEGGAGQERGGGGPGWDMF